MNDPYPNKLYGAAAEFEKMVRAHDMTFEYSDDHRVWQKGRDQLDAIYKAAAMLPRAEAVAIWNKVVNVRFALDDIREQYRWKE